MQVSLEPEGDGPFEPGSTVTVTVRTRDNAGRPVAGELSLAVVDEAIYAIGGENDPGLFGNFWGERATNVSTSTSFSAGDNRMEEGRDTRAVSMVTSRLAGPCPRRIDAHERRGGSYS